MSDIAIPLPSFIGVSVAVPGECLASAVSSSFVRLAGDVRASGAALDKADGAPPAVRSAKLDRYLLSLERYLDYRDRVAAMGVEVVTDA